MKTLSKSILFLSIVGGIFLFMATFSAHAQQATSCAITKVGSPVTTPALPSECVVSSQNGSTCTYYGRGGGYTVGNTTLADTITTIASKTNVPPAVLFGIMRIETPDDFLKKDVTYFTNDYNGVRSSAGAIGIMQFLPSTFAGVFTGNKTELQNNFNKLTYKNSIEPQITPAPSDSVFRITSIKDSITAAAFYARELKTAAVGSDGSWSEEAVKNVAKRYHGACPYPGGGGDYCDDLWKSVQACTNTPRTNNPVPPPLTGNKQQALITQFGVTMEGFNDTQLGWAWDLLWRTSNTKFPDLVRGAKIIAVETGARQVGCFGGDTSVYLPRYSSEGLFTFIMTHELGHVIRNCHDRPVIQFYEHESAFRAEKGVSYYANNAATCTGSNNISEDYADMIAYYLHPSAGLSSCGPNKIPPNPFLNNGFPMHYTVARTILTK